jgi:hypothetical protein
MDKAEREQEARRVSAEHAKTRDAAKQVIAKKNEKAHQAAVKSRRKLDVLKAQGRKGLEF